MQSKISNLKSSARGGSAFGGKISNFPRSPGVYQFVNKDGEIIYVGKAKNLRSRVGQYFNNHDNRPQLPFLMAEATDVTYTVVNNELESAFLENTLIKKYLPRYNIMLRDDKNYAFIKIDYSTEIPQIGYARKTDSLRRHSEGAHKAEESQTGKRSFTPRMSRGAGSRSAGHSGFRMTPGRESKFFGPYSAAYKIRNTLNLVRKIFPFCSAQKVGNRPCFYYYMRRCPGVCIGKITLDEYNQHIERIVKFLKGETGEITKEIKNEMKTAAKHRKFETAARLRDQLRSLELLQERQNVIMPKKVDWDIVSLSSSDGYACVNLFKVRGGKLFDKENFVYEIPFVRRHSEGAHKAEESQIKNKEILHPSDVPRSGIPLRGTLGVQDGAVGEIQQKFLEQYYLDASGAAKEIFLQYPIADPELVKKIIKSRLNISVKIKDAQRGKIANLIKLGQTNAQEYLKNWLAARAGHLDKINEALSQLKDVLNLPQIPKRIECYDISNTQGTNPVGSMVVFQDGLPAKSQYRKFKIQGKSTPDDFAMMREMLTRRLARINPLLSSPLKGEEPITTSDGLFPSPLGGGLGRGDKFWPIPDLIIIDGGKGQLGVAVEVLDKLKVESKKLKVIGLAKRIEEIFLPNNPAPIILGHNQPALQMLQRLRDEAHRFGITFHRKLRSKQAVRSALDDIPGIGPKTKKLLKAKFGTVAEIKKADADELAKAVGEKMAENIKQNL